MDLYNKNKDRASFEEMKSAELMEEASETKAPVYEPSSPPQHQGATTIEHKGVQADIPVQEKPKQVSEENKDHPPSPAQLKWIDQFIDKGLVVHDSVYDENGNVSITKQEASNLITLNRDIK